MAFWSLDVVLLVLGHDLHGELIFSRRVLASFFFFLFLHGIVLQMAVQVLFADHHMDRFAVLRFLDVGSFTSMSGVMPTFWMERPLGV